MINPNFEDKLSPETEKVLNEKYEEGVALFNERLKFVEIPIGGRHKSDEGLEEKPSQNDELPELTEEELQSLWDKWE
jgi:hypothetical protein